MWGASFITTTKEEGMINPETADARQARFIATIASVIGDQVTAEQVFARLTSELEPELRAMVRLGDESLAETVGIDKWRLRGDWYRPRRTPWGPG
jgi:hypothetical protein